MKNYFTLNGKYGKINIIRLEKGIPKIKADCLEDIYYGLGYIHGYDRGFQMWFMKILAEGRISEHFGDRKDLVEIDRYFRRLNFTSPVKNELENINSKSENYINAYISGVNSFRENCRKPLEFRITGVKLEPWHLTDSLALLRIMSYIGLAGAQGSHEKVLVEIIQHGKNYFDKMSKLFYPYLNGYDYNWYTDISLINPLGDLLPFNSEMNGSNNWAVSGDLTSSGKPIFCNDPHLEVSRLPSIWYEAIIETPKLWCMGVTLPGTPGFASGWNGKVAWGMTFSCADTEDFFIEKCKNGQYYRDNKWYPFNQRKEIIKTKKGRNIEYIIYENDHGTIEGNPNIEGVYLARKWSGMEPIAGDSFNGFLEFPLSEDVNTSMKIARKISIPTLNWVFTDSNGNIGYQMSGNIPKRSKGLSGLLPIPGWDSSFKWEGYISPEKLPHLYNPKDGFITTANNRLDHNLTVPIQTMTFPPYRADRISSLIKENIPLDSEKMKEIQNDVYSLQAERIINFLSDYLKGNKIGQRLLNWNKKYDEYSVEATIFKKFYDNLFLKVCSKNLFPEDIIDKIYYKSFFAQMNIHLIEDEWMRKDGLFSTVDWKKVTQEVLHKLSDKKFKKWGKKNSITMRHLLFGKTILGKFGFNAGPYPFKGCENTVSQGTKYYSGGQEMSFGPSYRMIVDFAEEKVFSSLPGGSSGRPFTRYYKSEIKNWLKGEYKSIKRNL